MSSTGLLTLRAVLDAGSVTTFRSLKAAWFTDDEKEAYKFVQAHFRRYNRLPDVSTLKENGYTLPSVKQPAQYYIDRLSQRAVFNAVTDASSVYQEAMKSRDVDKIKSALNAMVQATRVVENKRDYTTLVEQAGVILQNYQDAKRKPGLQGITTGYQLLDDVTNGLAGGDILIIAGRPNMGKSYKLLSMLRAAWNAGYHPGVVSMEMTSSQLSTRLIGMETRMNPDLIRRGELSTMIGEPRLINFVEGVADRAPLHFLEGNFRKTVGDVRVFVQEFSPDILYIDAGYLLHPEVQNRNFSKRDYVSAVMEEVKCIAQDANIPIVMSVQLNRQAKQSGKKQLDLSFLAETDVIGQIATLVIGMVKGKVPLEDTTREYQLIKNREGKLITYQGQFQFNPMCFDYIPGTESAGDGDDVEAEIEATQNGLDDLEAAGWTR
jgi:replicative DNA helicase